MQFLTLLVFLGQIEHVQTPWLVWNPCPLKVWMRLGGSLYESLDCFDSHQESFTTLLHTVHTYGSHSWLQVATWWSPCRPHNQPAKSDFIGTVSLYHHSIMSVIQLETPPACLVVLKIQPSFFTSVFTLNKNQCLVSKHHQQGPPPPRRRPLLY